MLQETAITREESARVAPSRFRHTPVSYIQVYATILQIALQSGSSLHPAGKEKKKKNPFQNADCLVYSQTACLLSRGYERPILLEEDFWVPVMSSMEEVVGTEKGSDVVKQTCAWPAAAGKDSLSLSTRRITTACYEELSDDSLYFIAVTVSEHQRALAYANN